MIGDKKDAYEKEEGNTAKKSKMQSLLNFEDQLAKFNQSRDVKIDAPVKTSSADNIQKSTEAYREAASQLNSFYQPTKEQENQALMKKVDELMNKLEEARSVNNTQSREEEMMERSYKMAAKYLTPASNDAPKINEEEPVKDIVDVRGVIPNTVSGLQQDLTGRELIDELIMERNYGFNTAVGSSYKLNKNTFSACIGEEQTIVSGQRVKMRLLEPLQAGNIIIPANSPVTGTANIQGERLDITISSIEYSGNILPVQMIVHDTDGQIGIYVPDSDSRTAGKEAVAGFGESVGTTVSVSRSAGQQIAMDLSRGALQGGAKLLSKKVRAVKVTLKAGYKVYLVAKEN